MNYRLLQASGNYVIGPQFSLQIQKERELIEHGQNFHPQGGAREEYWGGNPVSCFVDAVERRFEGLCTMTLSDVTGRTGSAWTTSVYLSLDGFILVNLFVAPRICFMDLLVPLNPRQSKPIFARNLVSLYRCLTRHKQTKQASSSSSCLQE